MVNRNIYQTLATPTSIRLLHLHAGTEDGKVHCSLSVHEFEEAPKYEALSYVWGQSGGTKTIWVDKVRLDIGENLFDALRQLRPLLVPLHQRITQSLNLTSTKPEDKSPYDFAHRNDRSARMKAGEERVLWVDALCVDQQDYEEKGHQVKLMGSIYTRAARVVIWLGVEEKDAMNSLQILDLASKDRKRTAEMEYLSLTSRDRNQAPPGYPSYREPSWDSLIKLFDQEWFERIWVVQEAALAQSAIAVLGEFQCEWDVIGDSALWFCESNMMDPIYTGRPGGGERPELVRSYIRMLAAADIQLTRHKADTLALTLICSKFECTIPVDRIYGILGLIDDVTIEPDYTVPLYDVFRTLAMQVIKNRQDLLILGQVNHTPEEPISTDAPSWTPRWPVDSSLFIFSRAAAKDLYQAANKKPLQLREHEDERHLCLKGIKVSKVTECGPFVALLPGVLDYPTLLAEMSEVMKIYGDAKADETIGCYKDELSDVVLANVLTAGQSRIMEPSSYDEDFEARARGLRTLVETPGFTSKTTLISPTTEDEKLSEYIIPTVVDMCRKRRYLKTEDGHYGIGPEATEPGDEVAVLYGGMTVFILRPVPKASDDGVDSKQLHQFVGEAYVHGIMRGEIVQECEEGLRQEVDFDLI
jgi:hypothetical protein